MEFKKGSIVKTKKGEYVLKQVKKTYNANTLQPIMYFVADDNGKELIINEKDVISIGEQSEENIGFLRRCYLKILKIFKG